MNDMPLLDGLLRYRYLLLGVLTVFMFLGEASNLPPDNDWQFFTWGSDLLFGAHYAFVRSTDHFAGTAPGGLHLYANYPFLQIGPPSLLVAKLLQWGPRDGLYVGGALTQGLGLASVYCMDRATRRAGRWHRLVVLLGGGLALVVWTTLVHVTHIDDAITVLALVGGVWAVRAERPVMAGLLFGLAAASKPWGVAGLGLVLALPGWRCRCLAAAVASAVILLFWGPFVVADLGTLDVGRVNLVVFPSAPLGVLVSPPVFHASTLRLFELGVSTAIAAGISWRSRAWALAPLAAFAARLLVDPAAYQYYAASITAAALLADLALGSALPWLTCVATVSWLGVQLSPTALTAGWIRLVTDLGLLVAALVLAARAGPSGKCSRSVAQAGGMC